MQNNDHLFSDIQHLCSAMSDWLMQKSIIQMKPTRQYPVPVVTSCEITAEPVNKKFRPGLLDLDVSRPGRFAPGLFGPERFAPGRFGPGRFAP